MNITSARTLLLSLLPLLSSARPLEAVRPTFEPLQKRASYSVVNVDGSSSTTTSAAPVIETVVHTVTAPRDSGTQPVKTIIIVEPSPPPQATETIIATLTIKESAPMQATVITLVPPTAGVTNLMPSSSSPPSSSSRCTTSISHSSVSLVRATSTSSTNTSTQPYDNGMWHTRYPATKSSIHTTSLTYTSSLASSVTTTVDASLGFPALSTASFSGYNSTTIRRYQGSR